MTPKTSKAQLHLAMERYYNPYAEYNAGFQDLFGQAMDQALGVQKASLAAVVKIQNDVIEMQRLTMEREPAIGSFFEAASQAYATCLEIQLSWFNMMVGCAKQGTEMWYRLAATGSSLVGLPAPQPQSAVEEEDYEERVRAA